MEDSGLRVTDVLGVTPLDGSRMDDGRHYELAVTNGKDTTGRGYVTDCSFSACS